MTTDEQGRFEIRGVGRERHLNLTFKSETLAYQVIGVVTRDMAPVRREFRPAYKGPLYGARFTVAAPLAADYGGRSGCDNAKAPRGA